jgi:ATP-dependent Lon protease
MTGEITLRGLVLPVGGIKHKVLAAKSAGIGTVILPRRNRRDFKQLPPEVTRGLEVVFAGTIDDVLKTALDGRGDGGRKPRRRRQKAPA